MVTKLSRIISKPVNFLLHFFFAFLKLELNFQCFETKMSLIAQVFLKFLTPTHVLV